MQTSACGKISGEAASLPWIGFVNGIFLERYVRVAMYTDFWLWSALQVMWYLLPGTCCLCRSYDRRWCLVLFTQSNQIIIYLGDGLHHWSDLEHCAMSGYVQLSWMERVVSLLQIKVGGDLPPVMLNAGGRLKCKFSDCWAILHPWAELPHGHFCKSRGCSLWSTTSLTDGNTFPFLSVTLGAAGVLETPGSSNNYSINQSLFCTLLLWTQISQNGLKMYGWVAMWNNFSLLTNPKYRWLLKMMLPGKVLRPFDLPRAVTALWHLCGSCQGTVKVTSRLQVRD